MMDDDPVNEERPVFHGNAAEENGRDVAAASEQAAGMSDTTNPPVPASTKEMAMEDDTANESESKREAWREPAAAAETDSPAYVSRDAKAKGEEDTGKVLFKVICNDSQPQHMIWLTSVKNIFAQQLPKMPREYIVRLVFDRRHRTLVALKEGRVVGGICFRPFFEQRFAEIAFLAITSSEQVRGYGTRLMNHLKEAVKTVGISDFLTYADNFAIGYFEKQGFTEQINMEKKRWSGYIKDYEGGTLMHCTIYASVNYLDIPGMIQRQKQFLMTQLERLFGPDCELREKLLATRMGSVASLQEASRRSGWQQGAPEVAPETARQLQDALATLTEDINGQDDSWPFREPVDTTVVTDYLAIIKHPMDLRAIRARVREGYYHTLEEYMADLKLMLENCRQYNRADSDYVACADRLERYIVTHAASVRRTLQQSGVIPLDGVSVSANGDAAGGAQAASAGGRPA